MHNHRFNPILIFFAALVFIMECMAADPSYGMKELYIFSGVSDDGSQGGILRKEATSVHCTNIGTTDANIEVQVFTPSGLTPYTETAFMWPGSSFTFSTQNTTIYYEYAFFGEPGTGPIAQGYGRVLSDSGNIICTAQVLDPLNYPPKVIAGLEMFRSDLALPPAGLPVSSGGKKILYYFTGVSDDGEQGSLDRKEATSIHCTNIGSNAADVEVAVYSSNGGTSYSATLQIEPGETKTYSTQNTEIYAEYAVLPGWPGTGIIEQGYGRILSSSKDIVCSAQVIDPKNNPPEYAARLPLFDKDGYPVHQRRESVFFPIVVPKP